jgi:hypothetical protein
MKKDIVCQEGSDHKIAFEKPGMRLEKGGAALCALFSEGSSKVR